MIDLHLNDHHVKIYQITFKNDEKLLTVTKPPTELITNSSALGLGQIWRHLLLHSVFSFFFFSNRNGRRAFVRLQKTRKKIMLK